MATFMRWSLIGLVALCVAAAILAAAFVAQLMPSVPTEQEMLELRSAEPSVLLSADGKPLAAFRRAKQERIRL